MSTNIKRPYNTFAKTISYIKVKEINSDQRGEKMLICSVGIILLCISLTT